MVKYMKEKIGTYLASHSLMTLATVSPDGKPMAHTVDYVFDGSSVYFLTDKRSRKASNIIKNPNVSLAVNEYNNRFLEVQGVQMQGTAAIITDMQEAQKIAGELMKKYPEFSQMGPNPNIVFFKIAPVEGHFLNNSIQPGHKDIVTY